MQPYNYQIQTQNPFEAAIGGLQLGMNLQEIQAQRQAKAQAQALQIQQQEAALQRQQLMQQEYQRFMSNQNPTFKDYQSFAMLQPDEKKSAQIMSLFDAQTKQGQTEVLDFTGKLGASLTMGNAQLSAEMLRSRAESSKNSGKSDDAKLYDSIAQKLEAGEINTGTALKTLGMVVSQLPGGDKVIEGWNKLSEETRKQEMQPTAMREAQAKATTAEVGAKFVESKAISELEQAGWNIKKMQADMDIAKQNARIAAMNAATAREGNTLKKQELQLKVNEAIQKRDGDIRGKVAEVENARFNIDNLLNTADRIVGTPLSVIESATGPISLRLPTLSQDTADFESLIENLDAQAFLSQIPQMKGTGALSENEGKKLAAALQSLSLKQSPAQLIGNVKEMQRLMLKARKSLADKYGMPENVPDTPAAAKSTSAADIDALIKKYGDK